MHALRRSRRSVRKQEVREARRLSLQLHEARAARSCLAQFHLDRIDIRLADSGDAMSERNCPKLIFSAAALALANFFVIANNRQNIQPGYGEQGWRPTSNRFSGHPRWPALGSGAKRKRLRKQQRLSRWINRQRVRS